jgi:hypothetical protein
MTEKHSAQPEQFGANGNFERLKIRVVLYIFPNHRKNIAKKVEIAAQFRFPGLIYYLVNVGGR